jgi:hypothetical protein
MQVHDSCLALSVPIPIPPFAQVSWWFCHETRWGGVSGAGCFFKSIAASFNIFYLIILIVLGLIGRYISSIGWPTLSGSSAPLVSRLIRKPWVGWPAPGGGWNPRLEVDVLPWADAPPVDWFTPVTPWIFHVAGGDVTETWPRPFPTPSFKPASEIRVCCGFCVACCFNECQTWTVRFLLVRKVIPMRLLKTLEHRCRVRLVWTIPNRDLCPTKTESKEFSSELLAGKMPRNQDHHLCFCFSWKPSCFAVAATICFATDVWIQPMLDWLSRPVVWSPEYTPGHKHRKTSWTRLYPLPNAIPGVSFHVFHGFLWISMQFRWYPPVN